MKQILITALVTLCLTTQAQDNARMIGASDPNNDPDWVWYQEYTGGLEMFYEVVGQSNPVQVPSGKQTPFFTSGDPLNTVLSKKDMWPEDGWVLAYRDFGTSTSAPAQPFFVLYNKYRGTLRYIFYNAQNISYTYYRAELSFVDSQFSGALMTFSDDEHAFLNDYDANNTLNIMGKVAVFQGWGYADFQLFGYDPTMDLNSRMRIQIWGIDESVLDVESTEFTLNQVLDDANLEGSTGSGGNLIESFEKGQKIYKTANSAKKGLSDFVSSETKKLDEDEDGSLSESELEDAKWWFNAVSAIAGDDLVKALPVIGGVAGFINSFFFSGESTPTPMKFEGSLKLEGTITTTELLISDDFILNSNASPTSQYYIPVNNIPFGVFNLVNRPEIAIDQCNNCGEANIHFYKLNSSLNYTFNEDSEMDLVSMKAAYIYSNNPPTEFENPIILEDHVFGVVSINQAPDLPTGISLELKFITTDSKNNGSEITVFKTYPIEYHYTNDLEAGGLTLVYDNDIVLEDQQDFLDLGSGNTAFAINTITAGNNFYLGDGLNDVMLIAGDQVLLTPGFHADLNSSFHAIVPNFSDMESARSSFTTVQERSFPIQDFYSRHHSDTPDFGTLQIRYNEESNGDFNNTAISTFLSIYPNPSNGNIKIQYELEFSDNVSIEIVNLNGKRIYFDYLGHLDIGKYAIPISLTQFKEGIYFVSVFSKNGIAKGKVLIID